MILQTVLIGLSPAFFGYNGLYLCSLGSLSYGMYAYALPGRMLYRLKPRAPAGSSGELCVRDLLRALAIFSVALGAMGLSICLEDVNGGERSSALHYRANAIFFGVGLVSIHWDLHLMRSKHWEANNFQIVNIAANTAICIAGGSGLVV